MALVVSAPLFGGDGHVLFVPWKVLGPGDSVSNAPLTVYWIPASPDEMRRSDFITSRALALFASRCVSMHVVRADDLDRLEMLKAESLPMVLVFDGSAEIGRVANHGGPLRLADVETIVRQAIDAREFACDAILDSAKKKIAAGESAAAIELYRKVWDQRCAFPRQGREAQRALKRMRALQ
jgi:hypothetical protein